MIPTLGFTSILLALILSLLGPFFAFVWFRFNRDKKLREGQVVWFLKYAVLGVFGCVGFSFLCLIFSYIISDFSVVNVYQNSHQLKPFIYKISGTWGNHEGSILLLITILSSYSLAFAFLSKISDLQKIIILSVQLVITFGIIAFVVFTSNPFLRIFPAPLNGLGLNPVLQDIGLAMHPPMLYTGYIGFSLIFSFGICALLLEKIDKDFAVSLRPWLTFSWSFLTLGIGLGSWWAYRELGWGGYWFWDPVENVSLMPWLCATALLHSNLILQKNGSFKIWTVFLSILTFIFCLLGIFLVRSGILTSVHSFANDPARGIFIMFLLLLIGGGGFLIFFFKALKLKTREHNHEFSLFSKAGFVLINNFLFCLALFIVVLGTLYPLLLQLITSNFISVGPYYYQKLFAPLALPMMLLMIFVPYLKLSEKFQFKKYRRKFFAIFLFSLIIFSLIFFLNPQIKIISLLLIFLAIMLVLFLVSYLAELILTQKNKSLKQKLFSPPSISFYSLFLGHLGIALVIIAISGMAIFSKTKEANLKIGEKVNFDNYTIEFKALRYGSGANYIARIGDFEVSNHNEKFLLKPESRYFPVSDHNTSEAAIKHKILSDFYLVMGGKDEEENYAIRIYFRPMISFLWLGCFLIFASGILVVVSRVRRYIL